MSQRTRRFFFRFVGASSSCSPLSVSGDACAAPVRAAPGPLSVAIASDSPCLLSSPLLCALCCAAPSNIFSPKRVLSQTPRLFPRVRTCVSLSLFISLLSRHRGALRGVSPVLFPPERQNASAGGTARHNASRKPVCADLLAVCLRTRPARVRSEARLAWRRSRVPPRRIHKTRRETTVDRCGRHLRLSFVFVSPCLAIQPAVLFCLSFAAIRRLSPSLSRSFPRSGDCRRLRLRLTLTHAFLYFASPARRFLQLFSAFEFRGFSALHARGRYWREPHRRRVVRLPL